MGLGECRHLEGGKYFPSRFRLLQGVAELIIDSGDS